MSQLGQSLPKWGVGVTSAFSPVSDRTAGLPRQKVRFVPAADIVVFLTGVKREARNGLSVPTQGGNQHIATTGVEAIARAEVVARRVNIVGSVAFAWR